MSDEKLQVKKYRQMALDQQKSLGESTVKIVIQVNGKTKKVIEMKRDVEENEVIKILEGHENISKMIKQNNVKRTIFVKNKLINFVFKSR